MGPYADPEQVLGPVVPPQVEGRAPAAPSDHYLIDPSVALGPPVVQKGWVERTYDEAKKMVRPFLAEPEESTRRAKAIVGSFGVMGDMIAGLPAGVARHFQFAIMTPTLQALGADPKLAAQASKQLQEKIPEEVSAPFRKIFVALGQEEAYEKNPLSTAFNLLNEVVAKGSKGVEKSTGIPAEWLEQAVDSIFTGLGVAGTNAAIRSGRRYNANAAQAKEIAKAQEINRAAGAKADAIKTGDAAAIAERDAALAEITSGPKEFRAILAEAKKNKAATPDEAGVATVSRIFDEARGRTPADAIADSQARIAAMQKAEAARVVATDGVASQVGATPKTRLAETPLIGEVTPPLRTAIAKLEKDGSALLGAEERIALQKAGQNLQILDRNGKPFERGQTDIKTLATLAAGAGTVAISPFVLGKIWDYFNPDAEENARYKFKKALGTWMDGRSEAERMIPESLRRTDENKTSPLRDYDWPDTPKPKIWDHTIDAAAGVGAAGVVFGRKGSPGLELVGQLKRAVAPIIESPARVWAERAIPRWLQKNDMGQGVADIEIPFREGTKKLNEVIEEAFVPTKYTGQQDFPPGIPPGESVWNLPDNTNSLAAHNANGALQSYLSHVGDYISQNVPVEKLGQYDLPRAIRETAANDARVAKEMDKAAVASMKDLPVYKDYGDGMKWVELKLPEKLTAEQVKGVRPAKQEDIANIRSDDWRESNAKGDYGYVPLDAEGKPIKNSYNKDNAWGKTPKEAWLAGRLAEEGNQMGHCVGGYCEGVAAGEQRIYSLRDAKGQSHVTVEVAPEMKPAARDQWGNEPPRYPEPEIPADILQIKGKQNRAPNAEYLPYVQDFVKKGKWGEVKDVENAGLIHIKHEINGSWGTLKEGFYTKDEFNIATGITPTERLGKRRNERGSIDSKLLGTMAAVGGSTVLGATLGGEDERTHGAILGAALGGLVATAAGRSALKNIGQSADYALGLLSTRIRNISEPLLRRGRDFERGVLVNTHQAIQRVDPFLLTLNKLGKDQRETLNRALLSNDEKAIKSILATAGPDAMTQWGEVRKVLAETGVKLGQDGWLSKLREDYFPRVVVDAEGLLGAVGKELRSRLDEKLLSAEKASMKVQGRGLTDLERSLIINKEIRSSAPISGRASFTRARGIDEVTPELEQFYAAPTESLHSYLRNTNFELEKAKFFGRDVVKVQSSGTSYVDIDASIGRIVSRELREGKITQEQMADLSSMLRSRFTTGEQGAAKWIQDARNLANIGLLGNFFSAATQLGDAIAAPFHADIRGTVAAVAQKIRGMQAVSARDFGLLNHLSEEFVNTRATAKALNTAFKWSAFTAVDLFGKDTILNASLNRFQRLSESPAGQARLMKEHGAAFEGDMAQLISDLQGKQITPLVQELLFNKLSDAQPITKMEVPQAYLNMPNGRVLYMLKTFMLKQMDIARVKGWNEIKKGNVAEGMKNLAAYGTLLGVAGATTDMVKDWMLGRPLDAKWQDVPLNALKTFGLSEYTLDMIKRGQPIKAMANVAAPPYQMLDDLVRGDPKVWNYLPIVGKLIYPHTEAGELAETKRQQKLTKAADPEYQERKETEAARRKELMKDPTWREYYLERAKGEKPLRPVSPR